MSSRCEVIVDKVFQSPSTPVYELAYLVKITNPDGVFDFPDTVADFDKHLIRYLEVMSRPNF